MRTEASKNAQQLVRSDIAEWESVIRTVAIFNLTIVFVIAEDSRATGAVQAACKEVGSISNIIFEMRFNSDAFSPGTMRNYTHTHIYTNKKRYSRTQNDIVLLGFFSAGISFPPPESEPMKLQERLLREAASFIITHQIPAFVRRSTIYILQLAHLLMIRNKLITCICIFVDRWSGACKAMKLPWTGLL